MNSHPRLVRTHVASKPGHIDLRPAPQIRERQGIGKPRGFWYEVNAGWRRWCRDEGWGTDRLTHLHLVELNDCNVLKIDTLAKLDAFHVEYGRDSGRTPPYRDIQIQWDRVAQRFDGIEIAPYQWSRRLEPDYMWYYGWDCASGVIWEPRNAKVIYRKPITVKAKVYA